MKHNFGSRRTSTLGGHAQVTALPERKIITFRDFSGGFMPSIDRVLTAPNASPEMHDIEIRRDARLQRVAGTTIVNDLDDYDYSFAPTRLFSHPTLSGFNELGLISAPHVGFMNDLGVTWYNVGLADRDEFSYTNYAGTLIFTDGVRSYFRENPGDTPVVSDTIPIARSFSTFGSRLFGFGTLIEGRFEPMGARWSAANGDFRDFDGIGAGGELLVNDMSVGDRVVKSIPMSFDFIAILMRQSIWVGRFTGLVDRPVDFSPRVSGLGAVNNRTPKLTRFGVTFLSDAGVYIFDGNNAALISKDINSEILPLDYNDLNRYHAEYDPQNAKYTLYTPTGGAWVYEFEFQRWTHRTITALDALLYARQIDPIRWFELEGTWNDQAGLIWLDYAGRSVGDLTTHYLGDQNDADHDNQRVVAKESRASHQYFGEYFLPYWESRFTEEQNAAMLTAIGEAQIEYQGGGIVRVHLPGENGRYMPKFNVSLDAAPVHGLNAIKLSNHIGRGSGIGIEMFPPGSLIIPGAIILPDSTVVPNA